MRQSTQNSASITLESLQLNTFRLYQSIHKPVILQTQTAEAEFAPDVDDLAWTEKPAINISALIAILNAYQQPANEQAALACFQAQLVNFSAMNLDQRMDYEEKLYFSLIFNDRPSLLVLDAASEYFDWKNKLSWIKSAQSKWNKQRFEALSQLAVLYRRVCQHYNPFFKHNTKPSSYWLTTHYHHLNAQNERDEWTELAKTGGLSALLSYVTEKPKHHTLYIIDVLLGGSLSYLVLTGILSDQILNYPALEEYYWAFILPIVVVAIMGGFLSALLLTGSRAAWQYWKTLEQKIHNRIKWSVFFVAIVLTISLAQQDEDGLLVFMVSSGFLLFIVLRFIPIELYQGFIQLENVLARIMNRIAQNPLVHKKFTRQQTDIKLHRITNINLLFRAKKITPQQSFNFKRVNITMNKQIYPLLIAQFLSAFGDNAILFTVLAIVIQAGTKASWYIPALQAVFLIAYVVLGPWVGGIADRHAKARILLIANLIKAAGTILLLIGVEPLVAYGIVGMGAAIYSPAKYGILPELVGHDLLVKANSWIEGSTILAILMGMKVGAMVADHSTSMALMGIVVLFIISAFATLALPTNISKKDTDELALVEFGKQMALFFTTPRSRFGVLGASIFWAAAASLRVILIAWAPLVLLSKNASQIADLTLYLTVGIIVGAIAVPKLIPLEHLRRARIPAYIMGVLITCLSMTTDVLSAQIVLFGIGIVGGMFIVPVNACLQEQGKLTIGSGSAVALQNFFQNLAMLLAVGAYTLAASQKVDPVIAMFVLGILVFLTVFTVSLRLPERQSEKKEQDMKH